MVNLHIFENNDIPETYKIQVLSFLRINSWEGFTDNNRLRDWITPKIFHPVNFVLEENDILTDSNANILISFNPSLFMSLQLLRKELGEFDICL